MTGIGVLRPAVIADSVRSRFGRSPVEAAHRPHVAAAVEWLEAAQDATGTGGIARGYALAHHDFLQVAGWEPAYPETTGYIIPTLYAAGDYLGKPSLTLRATRAAEWERSVQLESGAVQGGVIGQAVAPAVFNTGQVIFGWLAAFERVRDMASADAAYRAGAFLCDSLDPDGIWRRGRSPYASQSPALYNARTAWALAEAGHRLNCHRFLDAASRALRAVANRQRPNGWLPNCCLTDADHPLLHTLAYAYQGLLEGGRVLNDWDLIEAAARGAESIANDVGDDGRIGGRYSSGWNRACNWDCLTGNAQMANVWMRLAVVTGEMHWLEPVERVLRFLKSTQNRDSRLRGLRGGIKGSEPISGNYGSFETLSWATKFFIDALIRHDRIRSGDTSPVSDSLALA